VEAMKELVAEKLVKLKQDTTIDIAELEKITNRIVSTCSKDAISV
jgi:hypothetical protein